MFSKLAACVGVLKCPLMAVDFYLVCYGAPVLIERTASLTTMQFPEHALSVLAAWLFGGAERGCLISTADSFHFCLLVSNHACGFS